MLYRFLIEKGLPFSAIFIAALCMMLPLQAFAADEPQFGKAVESKEADYKTEPYKGQSSIECNGMKVNIPQFFPFSQDNLFLKFSERQCSEDHFEITVGLGEDCHGAHMCMTNFFSKQGLKAGGVHWALDEILDQKLKEIKLDRNIIGYHIPSRVFAYPTPQGIVWIDRDFIFVIGNNGGGEKDLVKSANSLINAE